MHHCSPRSLWPADRPRPPHLLRTHDRRPGRPQLAVLIWGQDESLEPLRVAILAATGVLAIALAFVPRKKSLLQVAAFSAALMLGVQLTLHHWFYLYIVWFFPLLLIALALLEPSEEPDADEVPGAATGQAATGAGTSTGSIESASPDWLTSTTAPITQTSSSAVSKRTGIWVEGAERLLEPHPDHPGARAGHADVGDERRPLRQHPRVGGRDVGVGAEHGGDASVQVPAHRHLLAGHLGVEVDDRPRRRSERSRIASTASKGERATFSPTPPLRLITATRIPPASTTVWPRPGLPLG